MSDIDNEILEADAKLNEKVFEKFSKAVVRKDLAFQVKGNLPVPTYVIEYLLAQYCQSEDSKVIAEGMERVKEITRGIKIRTHLVNDHIGTLVVNPSLYDLIVSSIEVMIAYDLLYPFHPLRNNLRIL